MSNYEHTLSKHRRLAILRHLEICREYTCNAAILQDVVNEVGVTSTRDQVVTDIAWLAENGFAKHEDNGVFVVVQATKRGVEIAQGIALHPDIQRPSPKA